MVPFLPVYLYGSELRDFGDSDEKKNIILAAAVGMPSQMDIST